MAYLQDDPQSAAAPGPNALPQAPRGLPIRMIRDDARLRLWRHRGQSRRLVLAFSSLGRETDVPPRMEFARTACADGRDHALYLADPQRSWLNAPGVIEEMVQAIETEAQETGAEEIVAMGHSLGGFSAMVLSGFTRIDTVLAFSPQLSVDPAVVPGERRWARFRAAIGAIRIRKAADHLQPGSRYYILFGRHRREAEQTALVPALPQVSLFVLPGVRHDSVRRLHEAGLLDKVADLAFARRTRRLRQILRESFRAVQIAPPAPEAAA